MPTHTDKTKENKSQTAASSVVQKQTSEKSSFQFEDNRPASIAQRKLQELAESSPRVTQLKAFHEKVSQDNPEQPVQLIKLSLRERVRIKLRNGGELTNREEMMLARMRQNQAPQQVPQAQPQQPPAVANPHPAPPQNQQAQQQPQQQPQQNRMNVNAQPFVQPPQQQVQPQPQEQQIRMNVNAQPFIQPPQQQVQPQALPIVIMAMGNRIGDQSEIQAGWTANVLQQDLMGRLQPGDQATITGGMHQNFGDQLGPHYTFRIQGQTYHCYPQHNLITAM